ncbi:MAG: DUF5320 domain-containing protein [Syntrophobacterales bacterium]|nr:DUF5320 domain-containing protein [Syntrophobacterales bacterium]
MPGGDRMGPAGMGPMTGRAGGYCAGYGAPGYANSVPGRGFGWGTGIRGGFGRGGGWGHRNQFYATGLTGWQRSAYSYPSYAGAVSYGAPYTAPYGPAATKQQELDALKGQAEYLEDSLGGIKKRMEELEKSKEE